MTFWKDLEENKVPMFYPSHYCEQINGEQKWKFKRIIKNCGLVAATDVVIKVGSNKPEEAAIMIPPGESVELNVLVNSLIPVSNADELFLEYKDLKGRSYIDAYESNITASQNGIRTGFKLKSRKYIDSNGKEREREF